MTTRVTKNKTPLSKELQKIRIDAEISRSQMAKSLKITDKQLALIEMGKAEVTNSFLQLVANIYHSDSAEGDDLIFKLRDAMLNSVQSVSFDMSNLDYSQKYRILDLKRTIEDENIAKLELIEIKKKEQKARKKKVYVMDKSAEESHAASEPTSLFIYRA